VPWASFSATDLIVGPAAGLRLMLGQCHTRQPKHRRIDEIVSNR